MSQFILTGRYPPAPDPDDDETDSWPEDDDDPIIDHGGEA